MTLPCQKALFALPDDVCYLNAAAYTPVTRAAQAAGFAGVTFKTEPWRRDPAADAVRADRLRAAAAALIGAEADDIAIVGAISHAIATAARALPIAAGSRILRVEGEFPSQSMEWDRRAAETGAVVDIVPRPANGDWTAAVLAAITRPGAPPLSVAALTPLHWTDGLLIDLARIAPEVHRAGAALVIDATQAVGVLPVHVRALGADFLAFPTYKWVLGPYRLALLYAAPHRQHGEPLERNGFNWRNGVFAAGARRYDMGERDDPVAIPTALAGLEQVAAWTPAAIAERLRLLTDRLAAGLSDAGLPVAPAALRVPHILGLRVPGLPGDIIERLEARRLFISLRDGNLRISPHVYNDAADIDRCMEILARQISQIDCSNK